MHCNALAESLSEILRSSFRPFQSKAHLSLFQSFPIGQGHVLGSSPKMRALELTRSVPKWTPNGRPRRLRDKGCESALRVCAFAV